MPELSPVTAGKNAPIMCAATVKMTWPTSEITVHRMWNTENRPWNVHCSLSAKLSVMINFSVKSAKAFTIRYKPSGEALRNTLLNAWPTCPRTLTVALNRLSRDRRISSRPPSATNPLRKSFRAMDMSLMTPPTQFPTAVNSVCAWLKSPIKIRQVSAHPDPMASCQVPII